jgi:hypothetical protein
MNTKNSEVNARLFEAGSSTHKQSLFVSTDSSVEMNQNCSAGFTVHATQDALATRQTFVGRASSALTVAFGDLLCDF